MTTYVAFLRAINVAGHAVVKMTDLRDAFRAAGCREVRSLIQSGNVVFESPAKTPTALVRRIQVELRRLLGEEPGLFLRTMRDIERLVEGNPFRRFAGKPRIKLYVAFLSRRLPPRQQPRLPLRSAPEALEVIAVKDREAFIVSGRKQNGFYGFPNAFIEQQLGVSATSRNWSTIKKIAPLLFVTTLGCASAPPPEPVPPCPGGRLRGRPPGMGRAGPGGQPVLRRPAATPLTVRRRARDRRGSGASPRAAAVRWRDRRLTWRYEIGSR